VYGTYVNEALVIVRYVRAAVALSRTMDVSIDKTLGVISCKPYPAVTTC